MLLVKAVKPVKIGVATMREMASATFLHADENTGTNRKFHKT
jgi:hypothetical protein